MPVYNALPFLDLAVRSVLAQSCDDFELICVNDGSTDASLEMLRSFSRSDPRVRIVSRPNTGIVRALNDGLTLVRGKYIARMDADDICFPNRFSLQCDFLDSHPDVVGVGSYCLCIDEDNDPISIARWTTDSESIEHELITTGQGGLAHPAAMLRSATVKLIGGYRKRFQFAEDKDLWFRMLEHGSLANLSEQLLCYRGHLGNTTQTHASRMRDAALLSLADAQLRRGLPLNQRVKSSRNNGANQVAKQYRRLIRAAHKRGNYATARKYLLRLIRHSPANPETWPTTVVYFPNFFSTANRDIVPLRHVLPQHKQTRMNEKEVRERVC